MLNMVNYYENTNNNFYKMQNEPFGSTWNNASKTPLYFNGNQVNNEVKQEPFAYSYNYSESSDSNPSPHVQYNSNNYNSYMDDNDYSDGTLDTSNDSTKPEPNNMKMEVAPTTPVNRGGRKQVKVGTNKRNARERNRVRYINNCFEMLREHIPVELVVGEQKNRKLSKVETLKYAAIYIKKLTDLLNNNQSTDDNICNEPAISDLESFAAKNQSNESMNYENSHLPNENQFASGSNLYYNNQFTINNKITNKTTSSIQFNNININIYDSKAPNEYLHSPALSSASSTSSSSSFGPYCNNTYSNAQSYSDQNTNPKFPAYFNCGKTSSLMMSSFLNTNNNSYGHVNYN